MRAEINNFSQYKGESLYEAWESFKELLRKFPHHGMQKWLLVQTFYNGLGPSHITLIDAAAGGTFNSKTENEADELVELMAMNNYQWPTERLMQKKPPASVNEFGVGAVAALTSQIQSLVQVLTHDRVSVNEIQGPLCDLCGGAHKHEECQVGSPFAQS